MDSPEVLAWKEAVASSRGLASLYGGASMFALGFAAATIYHEGAELWWLIIIAAMPLWSAYNRSQHWRSLQHRLDDYHSRVVEDYRRLTGQ